MLFPARVRAGERLLHLIMVAVSHIAVVGSLVYRTREALNADPDFLAGLDDYPFLDVRDGGLVGFWHYPGTQSEIGNILNAASEVTAQWQYPSLMDLQPVRQQRAARHTALRLNLVFAAPVAGQWTTEERERLVFEPLLRPLYREFMRQVARSGYFVADSYDDPFPHELYENFATGGDDGVIMERYGSYLSAIEVHNLELKLSNSLCEDQIGRIICENALVGADIGLRGLND